MLIVITRTGGFAGRERTGSADTHCRPDGGELERLAERALSAEAPPAGRPVADGFVYSVHIDGKVIELRDPDLTDEQRRLIEAVLGEGA
ncbi:protealysin inhibitor emfourin [Streptomyces sp. NPDC059104]|uniref:protealysin inhibitor emfourin n=1 Tax=Streptomyces sp. NPDC059104 TaxID=3346729 RepID=UPI00368CD81B